MRIERLDSFGKWLAIFSFRDVEISKVEETIIKLRQAFSSIEMQMFDADHVAGEDHLYFASINALKAFNAATNISENLAMEILLYASAQRQIKNAIEMLGVTTKTRSLAMVAVANSECPLREFIEGAQSILGGKLDNSVLDKWSSDKINFFKKTMKMSDVEIEAVRRRDEPLEETLKRLVVERIALLSTQL